jgi:hypothetical protein
MTQCTKCLAHIKNVIIIDNKPYGTECATTVLGIKRLPYWFVGGDWDKAKVKHDLDVTTSKNNTVKKLNEMDSYWNEWVSLSKAAHKAYRNNNEWVYDFITSIINQLGYPNTLSNTSFKSANEAFLSWRDCDGTFPLLGYTPKLISQLSDKQQQLINRNI